MLCRSLNREFRMLRNAKNLKRVSYTLLYLSLRNIIRNEYSNLSEKNIIHFIRELSSKFSRFSIFLNVS